MKYNIGDRVRIKSIDWYNENKDEYGTIIFSTESGDYSFTKEDVRFCGRVVTIAYEGEGHYLIAEDDIGYFWTDEMIEGLVEEEMSLDKAGQITDFEYEGLAYTCPTGYIFKDENGNIINTTKIVLEKKKKEYPKTYEECCRIMDIDTGFLLTSYDLDFWKGHLLTSLQKLLICRDAYWKIAGEEMGLGKDLPWIPDWMCIDPIYVILYQYHAICKAEVNGGTSCILAFPTEEMRDAFYENFKELIEQCKELL